ncbi:DUF1559 domain-containing protein [Novipirellula sp.]|uniref:DUF1559 family PulG-like putative transporter n=1 Tax=Novipirellula sp. TaxID=2795430 RepID=UPI003566202B
MGCGGQCQYTAVQTILPPNRQSCNASHGAGLGEVRFHGISTIGSHHNGGAHVLLGDGAVKFVTDSIEAGSVDSLYPSAGDESPFGFWGALGTRSGRESVTNAAPF